MEDVWGEGFCVRGRAKSRVRPFDFKGSGPWRSISDWGEIKIIGKVK